MRLSLDLGLGSVATLNAGGYTFVNAEAAALVARFTTPPTNARKALIDTLVGSLKTASIWGKLDALYLMAAADSQAARRNWKADTFNLTPASAPVFTADRGYQGDGVSSYLSTGFNPTTAAGQMQQDSASLFTWSRSDIAESRSDAGATSGAGPTIFQVQGRRLAGEIDAEMNNASSGGLRTAIANSLGLTLGTRTASNVVSLYRNAGLIKTAATVSNGLVNQTVTVLANHFGSAYGTKQLAASGFGSGMTAQNVADLHSALNIYLTAVGAA